MEMHIRRWGMLAMLVLVLGCAPSDEGRDPLEGESDPSSESSGTDGSPTTHAPTTSEPGSTSGDPDDASEGGTSGASSDDGSTGEPAGDQVLFAVGYGGLRVRSLDGGYTWQDPVQLAPGGGDDQNLLRGAAWGAGRFVAVGWKIFSSPDAKDWTEHTNPIDTWYGGVAYGRGRFLALGGGGLCARSTDGLTWEACTDATPDGYIHVRSVVFHEGLFWTADDQGTMRSSPDGEAWTFESNVGTSQIAVVDDMVTTVPSEHPAQLDDVWLSGAYDGQILRADPDSGSFSPVYQVPDGNSVFQSAWLAFGEGFVESP